MIISSKSPLTKKCWYGSEERSNSRTEQRSSKSKRSSIEKQFPLSFLTFAIEIIIKFLFNDVFKIVIIIIFKIFNTCSFV